MENFNPSQNDLVDAWITDRTFSVLPPLDVFALQREPGFSCDGYDRALCHTDLLFRGRAVLDAGSYTVFITGDDFYRLYINGEQVCFGPAPAMIHAFNVDRADVSRFIRAGDNLFAVEVYYQGLINREKISGDNRCGTCLLLCDADGRIVFRSGPDWLCARNRGYTPSSVFGYNTQFVQDYDFRLAQNGWTLADFDDSGWDRATHTKPDYTFVPAMLPPMPFYTQRVKPERRGNRLIYDFGAETVGYIYIKFKGRAGSRVILRSAEELRPDGSLFCPTRCYCDYEDTLIPDGKTDEVLQIDYKGFRYCSLTLPDTDTEIYDFHVQVRHHPADEDAFVFSCENGLMNDVIRICRRAVTVNSQYGYLDCVTREKGQYSGDMTIIGLSQLYLTGKADLYAKVMRDYENALSVLPPFNDYANCALYDGVIAEYVLQVPLYAETLYKFTADKETLARHVAMCDRVLARFAPYERADGLLEGPFGSGQDRMEMLVDWPTSLRDGYGMPAIPEPATGCASLINAFYIGALDCVSRMRRELGLTPIDTEPRKEAFLRAFYDADAGLFRDGETTSHRSLHAGIVPLYFGFYPREGLDAMRATVRQKGLSCGVYMAYFLLKGLCRAGDRSLAFDLITGKGRNSWYTMLQNGATAVTEAWDAGYKSNNSLCHAWASAPLVILVEEFLGVCVDLPRGGVSVNPDIPAGMGATEAVVPTPRGPVKVTKGSNRRADNITPAGR